MINVTKDFPLLQQQDVTYLDSAATSLTPQHVLDAMDDYYTQYGVNIHRGLNTMSEKASAEYEDTRNVVADFINAPAPREIIFTRNATEGVNLIAHSFAREILDAGDNIVTTILEHHANFVPWQQACMQTGAELKVIDVTDDTDLDIYDENGSISLDDIVTDKTWLMAVQYVSNVLGTVQPLKEIVAAARKINPKIIVLVDAAQAVPHMTVNVQDLDCDFLVFSAHKMCGPTGVGVLWGKAELLENMPPYMTGGDMIEEVYLHKTTFADIPHRFEAGTPDIAGVIGLKAAVTYLNSIGLEDIHSHEVELGTYAEAELQKAFGGNISIMGSTSRQPRVGIVAFTLKGCHPHDISAILDEEGVAVRAGHHCAMPLHTRFNGDATTRISPYIYNTKKDVDIFVKALQTAYSMLCPSTKK